ncbi:leucine-rich repeat-containing protein 57-like [Hydractinia symbiolongicarpus]|uniref:leucine-rich repeat-containing protein 57-like n=1 Tax=Hydractinia symbiolongicarpus TaxID=13093 RepID=UPI00254E6E62|nr:leucine-rich repeat-containing protein 57-like [Hydractinia symbiolongicarpus]
MGNSISPQIENAQKTGVCSLKGKKLKELPPEFSKLPKTLRTLDLSDNFLHTLPSLGQFVNLKSLAVDNNKLSDASADISKLVKLESLIFSSNLLRTFNLSNAASLRNLKTVNLNKNKIKEFPITLCQLSSLDAVDLSENFISTLPNDIKGLKSIELNLNKNRLKELNESISECPRLKVLRIEENCLPLSAMTENILKNSQIAVLAFEGNMFDMKQLQEVEGYNEYISRYSANKKKFV